MLPNSYAQSMYINPQQQQAPLPFGYGSTIQQTKPVFQPQPPNDIDYQDHYQRSPPPPPPVRIQQPLETQMISSPPPDIKVTLKPQQKFSYFIDWLLYILPIAFFIIILLVMALLFAAKVKHYNPEGAHNTLKTLKNNMVQNPIEDIVLATQRLPSSSFSMIEYFKHDDVECPEGYGRAALGQWDGVESGCICENGEISHSLTCFYKSGCQRVKSQDSKLFSVWQEKSYCTKFYTEWNPLKGAACETGYKQCGNICVPTAKNCPLSGFVKDNTRNNDPNAIKIGTDNYIKQFDNAASVVSLEIVPGEGQEDSSPCYNGKLNPQFESEKYYPLAKKPEIGCDQFKDLQQHRVTLNQFSTHQVYQQNDLTNTLQALPYYSNYQDQEDSYSLEIIKKIQISAIPECQKLSPNQVDQISKSAERVYDSERYLSLIILLVVGTVLFLVPILYLMRNRVFTTLDMTDFHQPKFLCGVALIVAILCIALGAVYLSEVDGQNGLKEHNKAFTEYLEKNCFPDEGLKLAVTQVNTYAKNTYHTTYSYVIWSFAISIVFVGLLVLFLIYQYTVHKSLFDNPWVFRSQQYQEFH